MEVRSKAKFEESTGNNRTIDFESESTASMLVNEMYTSLKKQKHSKLSVEELIWIEKVERAYGKTKSSEGTIICDALENAYHYLNSTRKWNEVDNKLYDMLEKIIVLRAKHLSLNLFLDNMETTIRSTLSLDFSNKAHIIDPEKDKRNILNYLSFALNMIIEKIETSMVSMKAVNKMLTAPPHAALIVTDIKGNIRFINAVGESLFDTKQDELLLKSIYPLFQDGAVIERFLENRTIPLNNIKVELLIRQQPTPVLLTASAVTAADDEIEECIFVIKAKEEADKQEETDTDLMKNTQESYALHNSISDMLCMLKSESECFDSNVLISFLEESLNNIRKDLQPSDPVNNSTDTATFIQDPVNIEFIYDSIIDGVSFVDGYKEVTFKKNILYENDFYSNSVLIYSVLQKLITAAIKLRSTTADNKIQFTVRDFSNSRLLMIIQFTSRTILPVDLNHLLEKNTKNLFNINATDTQLISVKEAIHRLKGTIETYIDPGKHTVFTISLPY